MGMQLMHMGANGYAISCVNLKFFSISLFIDCFYWWTGC